MIDILRGKAAANQSAEQGGAPRPPPRADQWEEEEEKGGVAERFPPKSAKLRPREGRGLVAPPTAEPLPRPLPSAPGNKEIFGVYLVLFGVLGGIWGVLGPLYGVSTGSYGSVYGLL